RAQVGVEGAVVRLLTGAPRQKQRHRHNRPRPHHPSILLLYPYRRATSQQIKSNSTDIDVHMPSRRIAATAAYRDFSNLLNKVELTGEEFIIERRGRAVARITSTNPYRITWGEAL